ncbi:MAG: sigma-54 dependent transcriptional regulator [Gammaproteobacteria bacterium]|nr:sigma-54 dependent transcriptional regulator [Gammaproteobacteria bacterium]
MVDDEPAFSSGIAEYLRLNGHEVAEAESLSSARERLNGGVPDVLLLDLMLPDGSGLELFEHFGEQRPEQIIIITGHSGVKSLIGGMAGDGVSYMTKPIEPRELLQLLESDDVGTTTPANELAKFGLLIGNSSAMQAVYKKIEQVAPTDSTVFVQGESGTGKELVAEAVHRLSGRKGKFVPVNCGGLSQELVGSQLFGHEKGSFTGANKRHTGFFERANDGTLFLDEITEMPADMQTHLLRALETGKVLRVGAEEEIDVNARLIAASNRDPQEAVKEGAFREDLYFRLGVFPLELPALRDRDGDIDLLADYFLQQLNEKYATEKAFSDTALNVLRQYHWPGNVRELKHAVHRAYIVADSDTVEAPDPLDDQRSADVEGLRAGRSIADVEKDLIMTTLEHYRGDKKAAAASLGVSLKTLYNRLKDYGHDDP